MSHFGHFMVKMQVFLLEAERRIQICKTKALNIRFCEVTVSAVDRDDKATDTSKLQVSG